MKTYRMKKWFDRSFWRIATTTAIALGTSVISIDAASVTVPPTAAAADAGNGSSLLISAIRLQQVYGAQLFPGGRLRIEEIRLRPSARFGQPFSTTISNLQIQLSTTAAHSEVLNAQFENNHGANKTVVFSGAAPVSSAFAGPTNGPKEIDVRIPLMTPFIYEPAAGNLLIDWQNFSGSTATYIDAAGSGTDFSSRAFALGGASTVATTVDNGAEVLELVFTVLPPPPGPNIAIANHSFEEPAVADGQYTVNNMPGWVGGGSWYHVANSRDDWFAGTTAGSGVPSPIDGLNIGGVSTGTTIYQDLAAVVQPGVSYTLTLLTGHRIGVPFGSPTVSLIAGGQVIAEAIPTAPAEGRFAPFQLTYNSPQSGPVVGQTLRIQLRSTGINAQPWFDDLKLTVSPLTPPPPVAPMIVSQPQNSIIAAGQAAQFSAIATGAPPLFYQWYFGGIASVNQTNSSLLVSNAQHMNAGDYFAVVSNAGGSVTSAVATLTVIGAPLACDGGVIPQVLQNVDQGNGSSVLRYAIRLQEVYGAQEFPPQPIIINAIRLRPSAPFGSAFFGVISNLQVNLSTTPKLPDGLSGVFAENVGTNDTVVFNGSLALSSGFTGPAAGPKDFDIIIPLQTPFAHDPTRGSLLVDFRNFSGGPAVTFVDAGAAPNDHASRAFALGATATDASTLDTGADVLRFCYTVISNTPPPVIAPTIVLQPRDTNVFVGQTTILRVGATGTAPLRYQWFFNNLPLFGRTSPFLVLSNVQPSQAGFYYASVSNTAGVTFSSNALLAVNIPSNRPPVALAQTRSLPEDSSLNLSLSGFDPDGNPLTYSISAPPAHGTLSGTPPNVTYTPAANFDGTDSFQFQVSDAQFTSAPATVTLQITASNDLPTLIATVGTLFPLGNGDTNWYILTTNNADAPVIFDASLSSDSDGNPLGFLWYLAGETEPFASGTVTTNTLPVGAHEVLVIIHDGVVMVDAPLSFEIVTAGDLLEILSGRINESSLSRKDKRPLLEALKKSGSEFDRNKLKQALEKLEHFRKKVRTHVSRHNPELAQEWLAFTDQILDAFGR